MTDQSTNRWIRFFNTAGRGGVVLFFLSFVMVLLAGYFLDVRGFRVVGSFAGLVMLLSAAVFIGSIAARDLAMHRWRFSLSTLLVVMTLVASLLGAIAILARH